MKIVIADDESLVRYSLKSMFGETGIAVTVVGEATNGKDLITLVRKHLPDVAFVDIKMPKLDGLAAIEAASAFSPATRWIILTSYSEFEYAQRAVKLGAVDYLLKPVSPEELKEVLQQGSRDAVRGRLAQNEEFESRMTALLNRTIHPDSLDKGEAVKAVGTVVVIDTIRSDPEREALMLELCDALREAMRESVTAEGFAGLVPIGGGRLCVVLAWGRSRHPEGAAVFKRFRNRAAQVADRFSGADAATTLLETGECDSYTRLASEVWRLAELAALRAVAGVGGVLSKRELEEAGSDARLRALADSLWRIADASRARQNLLLLSEIEAAERLLTSPELPRGQQVLKAATRFLCSILPVEPPAAGATMEWLSALGSEARRRIPRPHGGGTGGDLIDQLKAYLDLRYAENLKIAELARMLHITPNYLSNLFHQRVGTTFLRYLTARRMERARELLSEGNVQIQEVARRVGYQSTRHFSRLFKGFFGVYPSDLRDQGKETEDGMPEARAR